MNEIERPLCPEIARKMTDLCAQISLAGEVIGQDDAWAGELLRREAKAISTHIRARLTLTYSGFQASDRLKRSLDAQRETFIFGDEILLPARLPPDRGIVRDRPSWLGQICSLIGHCAVSLARNLISVRRMVRD